MKDTSTNSQSTTNLPSAYDPSAVEDDLYRQWEESGFFSPDTCIAHDIAHRDAPPFCVMLPPPNATGTLHIGHAVMLALQDAATRYHRMRGDRTLWIPGTDHAALATHEKVERLLWKEEHKTRHDIGRDAFLKKIDAFVEQSRSTMTTQMRLMGASLDWSREAFTLDAPRQTAVTEAFRRMFDDGIIYRGARIVNWDPAMNTTVSDDEIEHVEEKTTFYYLQYGPFVIGTARPETKFGDKYVVMHPDDDRYTQYTHGQKITLEWINGPVTATVIKDAAIDMAFGTGVMTITPWHDATDFDIATRHKLDMQQVIGFDGTLLPVAGEYAGLTITQARTKVIEALEKKGLVVRKEEGYVHNIATNARGGGIIEPQVKEQWFVSVTTPFERNGKTWTLKDMMRDAVESGAITIMPKRFEKVYFHWIDNLRDWCISRQIWYGHRIPVWYITHPDGTVDLRVSDTTPGEGWTQDPDTLDTWFSSGLWTFSALGWPEKTQDLAAYHPTQFMDTGYDILFFWIARMILMSRYLIDQVPFRTVYLHGLIRDEEGRKMSKSLGNVIDPRDATTTFGTDAVRLALTIGTTPGNDVRLGNDKIAHFRNMTNKLYNIGRYVHGIQQQDRLSHMKECVLRSDADHWIIARLSDVMTSVTHDLDRYYFSAAGETLRDVTWNDLADWYLEVHKIERNDAVLLTAVRVLLHLWHPFAPFVTEHLFRALFPNGAENARFLMVSPWPTSAHLPAIDVSRVQHFDHLKNIISTVRALRATVRIDAHKKTPLTLIAPERTFTEADQQLLTRLSRSDPLTIVTTGTTPHTTANTVTATVGDVTLLLHLDGLIDVDAERERATKDLETITARIAQLTARLSDERFTARAPQHIIEKERERQLQLEKEQEAVRARRALLK